MRSKGGTLRAQWLGKLLRDLRESVGLSLKDAGDHVLRDPSAISRMETGSTPARMADVRELMNLYVRLGVNPSARGAHARLDIPMVRRGWWGRLGELFYMRRR